MFAGLRIETSRYVPRFKLVQAKFPKTKRRRIQKKWAKKKCNFKQRTIKRAYVLDGQTLLIHPDDLEAVQGWR